MRDVEDDRVAEFPKHRERAHVHHEVVVAEADATLRHEDRRIAFGRDLVHHMLDVAGGKELSLLDVHRFARARRRNQEIGLAREERRDLQHVHDLRGDGRVSRLVDVGQDRQASLDLDVSKHP